MTLPNANLTPPLAEVSSSEIVMRRRAAAKLLKLARALNRWQVTECKHVSRRDNNVLFDAEMHMRETVHRVKNGYDA